MALKLKLKTNPNLQRGYNPFKSGDVKGLKKAFKKTGKRGRKVLGFS